MAHRALALRPAARARCGRPNPVRTQTMNTTPRGEALLNDPVHNKGTAFTADERRKHGLEGLLPHALESLDRQADRVLQHLGAKPTDLEPYIFLIAPSDRNETLFYRTLMSDPARF